MNILADESVDKQIVDVLRDNGFYIEYIAEMDPGISDKKVLQIAKEKDMVLLTADKDFGELVYRQKLSIPSFILLRLSGSKSDQKAKIVSNAINRHSSDIKYSFVVITSKSIRIRKLS